MGERVLEKLILDNGQSIAFEKISPVVEGSWKDNSLKPYIIFIHEGLGSMAMWKGFPMALCRRLNWPGIIYDRQGYGLSSPLSGKRTLHYLHGYALVELPGIIERLVPAGRPFFIVGHSDGGTIGLIYASEQNPGLRGVITEAAHIFVEPVTIEGIKAAVEIFEERLLEPLSKYHGDKTRDIFNAWWEIWLAPHFRYWNIEYLLPSIHCPVMAIQGVDDVYGTSAQVDGIVNGVSNGGVKVMIEKCGHSPHLEQRQVVLGKMADFMTEHMDGIIAWEPNNI
ncbi:MAG: alpha/beta hydrolase [Desulfamplus sp.]|nr:alpha/beta hydrolase [Desulfamplus sp.]